MKKSLITTSLLICFSVSLNAQLLTNNNVLISVTSGAQLTVKGSIQNNSGTIIINNGTIDLAGDWTNNSGNNLFGTSQGSVIMNGTNQLISGSDQTAFNTLILQNSRTILQQHTLTGGMYASPAGILNLNSSELDLSSHSLTVNNQNTAAVISGSGYILSEQSDNSSNVKWNIGTVTGNHLVPFGTVSGIQIPFSFNLLSGNVDVITVSTYNTTPNNTPYPVTPVTVTHVRNTAGIDNSANTVDRFWQLEANGNGNASLTFSWTPGENAANGNTNPRAQRWFVNGQAWQLPLPAQSNPSAQSVMVPYTLMPVVTGNQSSFPWAVSLESSPLPVELIAFTAKGRENNHVLCKWITASEINNDFFTVERSKDGREFIEIGKINGAGNSTSILNYSFPDEHPYPGTSYYRLKQTDFNGTHSYSEIISVMITKQLNSNFSVFPNPVKDELNIQFSSDKKQEVQLQLYDITGRKIISDSFISGEGINSRKTNVSRISKGTYFIEVTTDGVNNKIQIIKE